MTAQFVVIAVEIGFFGVVIVGGILSLHNKIDSRFDDLLQDIEDKEE